MPVRNSISFQALPRWRGSALHQLPGRLAWLGLSALPAALPELAAAAQALLTVAWASPSCPEARAAAGSSHVAPRSLLALAPHLSRGGPPVLTAQRCPCPARPAGRHHGGRGVDGGALPDLPHQHVPPRRRPIRLHQGPVLGCLLRCGGRLLPGPACKDPKELVSGP